MSRNRAQDQVVCLALLVLGVAVFAFGGLAEAHGWMHPTQCHFAEGLGGAAAVLAVIALVFE